MGNDLTCERGAPYEYQMGDRRFFSVSQVRRVAHDPFVGVSPDVLAEARIRGTLLHRRFWRCLAAHAGLRLWPEVLSGYEGFCASMDRWVLNRVVPGMEGLRLVEVSSWSEQGFAGTPDALVMLFKSKAIDGMEETIVDLKTGQPVVTDPMQLYAYHEMGLYRQAKGLVDLYVQKDGSGAVEVPALAKQRPGHWAWFQSALGVLKGRINHGVRR